MYCCRKRQVNILLNNNGKTLPLSTLWFQFQESPIFLAHVFLIESKKKKPTLLPIKIIGIQRNVFRYLFVGFFQ